MSQWKSSFEYYLTCLKVKAYFIPYIKKSAILGLYNLQTYINCYMLSKDKKLLEYPEVNIQLKIESRMKNNILRKICGIRDRLPDPDPYSDIRIGRKD